MRIFKGLKSDRPLVTGNDKCWICAREFCVGHRVVLKTVEMTDMSGSLTVEAKPVHATCALRGKNIPYVGIIDRIKDGDASPYPVIMTDGKQYKLEEVGLEE